MNDPLPARATPDVVAFLEHTVLRCEVGSTVHGTGQPGHEDHDQMGVFILPPERVLGTVDEEHKIWRTAAEGQRSTPDDIDLALYSARKFVRLAAGGNPSILVPLFTPDHQVFALTEPGRMLRDARDLFRTKQAGERFLGYMTAQLRRMQDSHAGLRAPRSNRPELVAAHGYDTKFAMHAIRLGYQGLAFTTTGHIELPVPGETGDRLRAIRVGTFGTYDDVVALGEDLTIELREAIDQADIPPRPDRDALGDLLWQMHRAQWGLA